MRRLAVRSRIATRFRQLAHAQGCLDPERPLPEDAEIAAALGQGVCGVVVHTTLKRAHGFTGHDSSVRRLIAQNVRAQPPEGAVEICPGRA